MSEINENVIADEEVTPPETTEEVIDTHEYVIIGGEKFQTEFVSTGINAICFALADIPIADVVTRFSGAKELRISGADLKPYGIYQNVIFASAMVNAEGIVTVTFRIATNEEIRLKNLEQTQVEQDEVIAELIGGGEE